MTERKYRPRSRDEFHDIYAMPNGFGACLGWVPPNYSPPDGAWELAVIRTTRTGWEFVNDNGVIPPASIVRLNPQRYDERTEKMLDQIASWPKDPAGRFPGWED